MIKAIPLKSRDTILLVETVSPRQSSIVDYIVDTQHIGAEGRYTVTLVIEENCDA